MDPDFLVKKHTEKYWLDILSGAESHSLFFLKPLEKFQSGNWELHDFTMDDHVQERLHKVSSGNQDGKFILLLACFYITYSRFSKVHDFVINSQLTNEGAEQYYRLQLKSTDTARSVIGGISDQWKKNATDKAFSLAPVVDKIKSQGKADLKAFKQIGFNNEPYSEGSADDSIPLVLYLSQTENRISFVWRVNSGMIELGLVRSFESSFQKVLGQMLESVDTQVGQFDLLDRAGKDEVTDLSHGNVTFEVAGHYMGMFDQYVSDKNQDISVHAGDCQLTYKQLYERVNQLSNYLRETWNIKKGDRVGVMLSRSEKNVVSMLALWRCGACYVPLDYHLPSDRLEYLISDIDPTVVISERYVTHQKIETACPSFDLDSIELDGFSTQAEQVELEAGDVAYIIYTSGSTGTPKGILQTHGMLYNLMEWQAKYTDIGHGLRFFQYTSFSFDVSIQDVCFILRTGGTLYIASEDIRLDFERMRLFLLDHKIEGLYFPYSVLNSFLGINDHIKMKGHVIRHIITGGEQVIVNDHIEGFLSENPNIKLHNQYGPSETHVVTDYTFQADDKPVLKRSPIGEAVANTSIYILDEDLNLLPTGVVGEAYIGGANVAKGYWNLPELTKQRFIYLEIKDKKEFVYRSGDIVRRWPDGKLEYIGREDDQYKINGYRIELGEIQKMLLKHESIADAVTMAVADENGDKHLTAYYATESEITDEELTDYLGTFLPDYMIPSFLIKMRSIPLTPNGKLDKKSLPDPFASHLKRKEYVKPETQLQTELTEIWSEVLGVSNIGIDDDFFELGGYSLKAMRLLGRLGRQFDVNLELTHIFKYSTVRKLSDKIEASQKEGWEAIPIAPQKDRYPLSRGQYSLWMHEKIGDLGSTYVIPAAYRIQGSLKASTLQKAVQLVVERHEILRTVIVEDNGEPFQVIKTPDQLPSCTEFHDYSSTSDEELRGLLDRKIASYTFDLAKGPLFVFLIYKCSEENYIVQIIMHHMITDAWSLDMLLAEVMNNYHALDKDGAYEPEPLKIHYKDYSVWQQECIERNQDKEYWMEHVGTDVPTLNLSNKPRPSNKTHKGAIASRLFSTDILQKLKELSSQKGCSLYATLTSIIQVFLARYTGQQEVVVGMPVAGRHHPDLLDQLGFYVNLLPLRSSIDLESSFAQHLEQTNKTISKSFEHQQYPFDQIVQDLQISTDPSRLPLFDIVVNYLNLSEIMEIDSGHLVVDPIQATNHTSKYDLSFVFIENKGLTLTIEYNTDLFVPEDIQRFFSFIESLSGAIVSNAGLPVGQYSLITEAEREKLADFQESISEYPRELPVHKIVESFASRSGNAQAIICEDRSLTYEALNARADEVAFYLQQTHGVRKGDLVALLMDRSEWVVISMLAILKIGAGYLPILPENPTDRIKLMLEDTGAKVILSDHTVGKELELGQIYVEDSRNYKGKKPLEVDVKPEDIAYVMYTSGSTGKPKGVMIPHRGIVRLVTNSNHVDFSPDDKMLQLSNVAFDAATFEIYGALLNGASLYMLPFEYILSPDSFYSFVKENGITVALIITPLFNNLVDELPEIISQFRKLYFGGEACSKPHVTKAMEYAKKPGVLVNLYGPTEGTTVSTYQVIEEADVGRKEIPIGKPISNTSVYILDSFMNQQPIGVIGEICIGGDGLAIGYMGREQLTREKFVDNPWRKGEKLYHTGDLGYWQEDGTITYKGRKDNQLKIRGYRIECGEVEHALNTAGAEQALVLPHRDKSTHSGHMVAYVSGVEDMQEGAFRQKLEALLPAYMIPSVIQHIDEFPLNTNGKIDHKQLPPIQWPSSIKEYVAPETGMEKEIADIWGRVLAVEYVGLDDNFFEIGGNSLKAVKIVKAMKGIMADFKVTDLYNYPTIRELTNRMGQFANKQDTTSLESFDL